MGRERRLEQGRPQRQVRVRRPPPAHEPLRDHRAELHLQRRRHGAERDGAAAPTFFNGYADFLLGLPITRNTALQNPLLNEDNGSNEQSATLRSWEYGVYVRDQFQLTRNLTVSAGVRWETTTGAAARRSRYRGLRFHHQPADDVRAREQPIDCGVKVQKDLFTPRLGVAYRAGESMVFRAGYSRNPQNDNMIGPHAQLPGQRADQRRRSGGNNFTPVGQLQRRGTSLLPILNLNQPRSRCRPA